MNTHETLELSLCEQLLPVEPKTEPIIYRKDMPTENTIFYQGEIIPIEQLSDVTRMLVSKPGLVMSVYIRPLSVDRPEVGLLDKLEQLESTTRIEFIQPDNYTRRAADPSRLCFSLKKNIDSLGYAVDSPVQSLSIDSGAWFVADDVGAIGDIPVLIDSHSLVAVSLKTNEGIHVSDVGPFDDSGQRINLLLEQKTRGISDGTIRALGASIYCSAFEVESGRAR